MQVHRLITMASTAAVFVAWAATAASAADPEEQLQAAPAAPAQTDRTAAQGSFLPFSQAAVLDTQRAYAGASAGYDTARGTGSFEAITEVRLWGPVALRGGAVYTDQARQLRPSVGARVQLARGRLDAAAGLSYRPEGLTEPEGEIEGALSIGKRAGAVYLLGNLLYGQDPEGRERDAELRLAALRPLARRWLLGFDARLRVDLGSDGAVLRAHHEATLDALAGPTVAAVLGPLALSLSGGASTVRLAGGTTYGLYAITGVGTAF
jgi:hypothetical protein